jgi:general secretion pathway protein H
MRRSRADRRAPGYRRCAGFTLVEVLVVLLLIGIAAGAVLPALGTGRQTGAGAAVRELTAVLAAARSRAVVNATNVTVTIELATGAYATFAAAGPLHQPDTLRRGVLPLGPDASMAGTAGDWAVIAFDALGRARGPDIRIHEHGYSYEVRVHPWTGRADVAR